MISSARGEGAQTVSIATAPGVVLAVCVAGTGPLVILMHGWPELGLSWRHQIASLVAAGYRVAVPDLRGYGGSSRPADPAAYSLDAIADDMAAVASSLGAARWVAVGHDWGAAVAWRCALRFPDAVAGIFSLSVPHRPAVPPSAGGTTLYPDRFYYVRYFQPIGPAEAELDADPRRALKAIFHALSGDAPENEWVKPRPRDARLLDGLAEPPPGPLSFMGDDELDRYASAYAASGFYGGLCWYRNLATNARQDEAYGEQRVRQPAGFLCGSREIVVTMVPQALEEQRRHCDDLRCETLLPGAGHWIQQERPAEVNAALIGFLDGLGLTIPSR